jgi:hypothetical protein
VKKKRKCGEAWICIFDSCAGIEYHNLADGDPYSRTTKPWLAKSCRSAREMVKEALVVTRQYSFARNQGL